MKLFIDDVRSLAKWMREDGGWTVARTGEEALALIRAEGLENIEFISFDNDLGSGRMEGYQVLNAVERMIHEESPAKIPNMEVHSFNPVASKTMWDVIHALSDKYPLQYESGRTKE
jgi:hypothetical protein